MADYNFDSTIPGNTTNVKQDNINSRQNELILQNNFKGTSAPSNPVEGQDWYDQTNKQKKWYDGSIWQDADLNSKVYKDVLGSYGSLNSLEQRLSVSIDDDGTLKTNVAANISEFKSTGYTFTFISANSFTVPSDVTSVFVQGLAIEAMSATSTPSYSYSHVKSSSYANSVTTVILYDSILDATLEDIRYGILYNGLPYQINNANLQIEEATGYGVISGFNYSFDVTPGMNIHISSGVVHMASGNRFSIPVTSFIIPTADSTNPRIDLIYVSSVGVVSYLAGTPSVNPAVPTLPNGGFSLGNVSVAANATTVIYIDTRMFKARYQNYSVINALDFGVKGNGIDDDTVNLQRVINYANSKNIKEVILPYNSRILISSTIELGDVILLGGNCLASFTWVNQNGDDGTISGGAISDKVKGNFIIWNSPISDTTSDWFTVNGDGGVVGVYFYDAKQLFNTWTTTGTADILGSTIYQPIVRGHAINFISGQNHTLKICGFVNCYNAIYHYNGDKLYINDIFISPINECITVHGLSAGAKISNINIYPQWSNVYGTSGPSSHVNGWADNHGSGIKIGTFDNTLIEETIIDNLEVIGVIDGVIMGGKGVSVTNFKIDNCLRPFTIAGASNSSYHRIVQGWATSFYGYATRNITDGTAYVIKISGTGHVQIGNVVSPRSDGYGIWCPGNDWNLIISNAQIFQNNYKAYSLGSNSTSGGHLYLSNAYAYGLNSSSNGIAFELGNFAKTYISSISAAGNFSSLFNYIGSGNIRNIVGNIDLSGVDQPNYSNGTIQRSLYTTFDASIDRSSTAYSYGVKLAISNAGGTTGTSGIAVRNYDGSGGGSTCLALAPSVGANPYPLVEASPADVSFKPVNDNQVSLGTAGKRYSTVYAATGTINTSDARLKTNIKTSDLGLDFILNLKPVSYTWISGGFTVDDEGNKIEHVGKRTHYGMLAQDVGDLIGTKDFAGYIYDKDTDSYGLRYEEFIAPMIKAIQELKNEIAILKSKI